MSSVISALSLYTIDRQAIFTKTMAGPLIPVRDEVIYERFQSYYKIPVCIIMLPFSRQLYREKLPTVNDRNGESLWGCNSECFRVALAKPIVKATEQAKPA